MPFAMRVMFIDCALFVLIFVIRKIKKSQIPSAIAGIFGFMSASNFVFLYVIAVLVIRDFTRSIRLSKQEQRINALAQEIALREVDKTE